MLANQRPTPKKLSERLTVRVPKKIKKLSKKHAKKSKLSMNKWVSEALAELQYEIETSRLKLPPLLNDNNDVMTREEHIAAVDEGVTILFESTYLFRQQNDSLPIKLSEKGYDALKRLITCIMVRRPENDKIFVNIKTKILHVALWNKLIAGKSIEEFQRTNY